MEFHIVVLVTLVVLRGVEYSFKTRHGKNSSIAPESLACAQQTQSNYSVRVDRSLRLLLCTESCSNILCAVVRCLRKRILTAAKKEKTATVAYFIFLTLSLLSNRSRWKTASLLRIFHIFPT